MIVANEVEKYCFYTSITYIISGFTTPVCCREMYKDGMVTSWLLMTIATPLRFIYTLIIQPKELGFTSIN